MNIDKNFRFRSNFNKDEGWEYWCFIRVLQPLERMYPNEN